MNRYRPVFATALGGSALALAVWGILMAVGAGQDTSVRMLLAAEMLYFGVVGLAASLIMLNSK